MSERELLDEMFVAMQRVLGCNLNQLRNEPRIKGGRCVPLPNARGIVFEQFRRQTGWSLRQMSIEFNYDRNTINCAIMAQQALREVNDAVTIHLYNEFHKVWGS